MQKDIQLGLPAKDCAESLHAITSHYVSLLPLVHKGVQRQERVT